MTDHKKTSYDLWRGDASTAEPLTLEKMSKVWDDITKAMRDDPPPRQPTRYVTPEVYKRAREAIAAGASDREVQLILMGCSRAQAKSLLADD